MLIVNVSAEKSRLPAIAAINGVMKSATSAVTTAPKATPDDDADGKVDDVASEQELLEVLEDRSSLRVEKREHSKLNAAAAPCLDRREWLSQVALR